MSETSNGAKGKKRARAPDIEGGGAAERRDEAADVHALVPPGGAARERRFRTFDEQVRRACRYYNAAFATPAFWGEAARSIAELYPGELDADSELELRHIASALKSFYFSDAEIFPTSGTGDSTLKNLTTAWRSADSEARARLEAKIGFFLASAIPQSGALAQRFMPALRAALELDAIIEMQCAAVEALREQRQRLLSTPPAEPRWNELGPPRSPANCGASE